jgi:hypothetical protein
MERALRENRLLEDAYFIGSGEMRIRFKGKARVSIDGRALGNAVRAGEDVSRLYFLFAHGRNLDREAIGLADRAGVPVVASINRYHHYPCLMNHRQAARADIRRLCGPGVGLFQIDSVYEDCFTGI